jgi:hypothetical protein
MKKTIKAWAVVNGTKSVLEICDCHKKGFEMPFIFLRQRDANKSKSKLSKVVACTITYEK